MMYIIDKTPKKLIGKDGVFHWKQNEHVPPMLQDVTGGIPSLKIDWYAEACQSIALSGSMH
jgi:hypothetical protein